MQYLVWWKGGEMRICDGYHAVMLKKQKRSKNGYSNTTRALSAEGGGEGWSWPGRRQNAFSPACRWGFLPRRAMDMEMAASRGRVLVLECGRV